MKDSQTTAMANGNGATGKAITATNGSASMESEAVVPAANGAHNLSTEQNEVISTVRSHLSTEQNDHCPDDMILRYVRATGNDTRHAIKRIQDTLAWWAKEDPKSMFCPGCRRDRHSHYMQVVGRDLIGRPLIYSCMEISTNKDIEENRRHMINIFESAIAMMTPGSNVESWCWILDFHGFSLRDCDPRLARLFLHLAATHYPERLGYFWIVDAPVVFSTLWNAIKSFIDPKTRNKITFLTLKKKEKLETAFREHFDEETVQWLMTEMEDNRRGGTFGQGYKFYDYSALEKLNNNTRSGDATKEAFAAVAGGEVNEGESNLKHCNLGTPAFLRELRAWEGPIPSQLTLNKHQSS
jgi:CRAL/TRIO domain